MRLGVSSEGEESVNDEKYTLDDAEDSLGRGYGGVVRVGEERDTDDNEENGSDQAEVEVLKNFKVVKI